MSTAHDTTVSDPAIEAAIAKATARAQAACDSWLAAEAEEMQAEEQLFKSMMEESADDNSDISALYGKGASPHLLSKDDMFVAGSTTTGAEPPVNIWAKLLKIEKDWKKFLTHSTPSPDIAKPQP